MSEPIRIKSLDPTLREEINGLVKAFDFSKCLTCGMCTAGCVYSELVDDNDPRKFIRKIALGMREELAEDPFVWNCNMCERCTVECPMGVNIAALTRTFRGKDPNSRGHMQHVVDDHIRTGNQMAVEQEDFDETIEWIEEELQKDLNDPDFKIPMNKPNADFMFVFNAREVKYYPNELQSILKVFYAAKADYTISSSRWDATNLALFSGKNDDFWKITGPLFEEADRLKPKAIVVTECGHAFRSVKMGQRSFWKGDIIPVRHVVELFAEWIKDGRLKLDKTKNPLPVTLHDPCNTVRKEGVIEPQRYVLKNAVMDFREMNPSGKYNICCGAGGGALAVPEFKSQRMVKAKPKVDQLIATGAKIGAIPCHNCMDQFNDMNKHYKLGMKMVHIAALIENALVLDEVVTETE